MRPNTIVPRFGVIDIFSSTAAKKFQESTRFTRFSFHVPPATLTLHLDNVPKIINVKAANGDVLQLSYKLGDKDCVAFLNFLIKRRTPPKNAKSITCKPKDVTAYIKKLKKKPTKDRINYWN